MRKPRVALVPTLAVIAILTTIAAPAGREEPLPAVLLPVEGSPLVTFRIQFAVGAVDDPDGNKGLTEITASLITEGGTRRRNYAEIVDAFYPMATHVGSLVDKEVTTLVGTVHRDNLERFYALFKEMVLEPGFREDDFERIRSNRINYLEKQLRGNDDENLGKEALNIFLYSQHPYGNPVQGLVTDLKRMTSNDVKNHYRHHFTRRNVVIGLAGDYPNSFLQRVFKDFQKLPSGSNSPAALPDPDPIEGIEVMVVEKECRSTAISLGFPLDVQRGDRDFYSLMIANSYFGEHRTFNGVLMNRMRQIRGLNYGDYSYIENFIQQGGSTFPLTNIPRSQQFFSIWIRPVEHRNRHFAIRLALWELEKLVRNGLSEEDFESTRSYLANYSQLWAQDQSRRLGFMLDSRFYRIDNYLGNLPERLQELTAGEVNDAIRRNLRTTNLKIAVVTRGADEFLADLIANNPSPITYEAKEMPAEVLEEDRVVAVYRIAVNASKSKVVSARELFE